MPCWEPQQFTTSGQEVDSADLEHAVSESADTRGVPFGASRRHHQGSPLVL
jgi:hypothetical protein